MRIDQAKFSIALMKHQALLRAIMNTIMRTKRCLKILCVKFVILVYINN